MALGNEEMKQRKYLSINNGKIELWENGTTSYYSYVEGRLVKIYFRDQNVNGKKLRKWVIELTDDDKEDYYLTLPYKSSSFRSIVMSLASKKDLDRDVVIKISPYLKGRYTNVAVFADNEKLNWMETSLPPTETVVIGSNEYIDDSKRQQFIMSVVDSINNKISNREAAIPAHQESTLPTPAEAIIEEESTYPDSTENNDYYESQEFSEF